MPAELILILGLGLVLLVPILLDINPGIVAFVAAFVAGTVVLDLPASQILAGFTGGMFVMLTGITLMLAIAHENGTLDWIGQPAGGSDSLLHRLYRDRGCFHHGHYRHSGAPGGALSAGR